MVDPLEILFLLLTSVMLIYLFRHYLFTLTVLRTSKTRANNDDISPNPTNSFEPFVSILIPARDEERVIGRLLQRMVELTYPKNKLEVIVIDDASSDNTKRIVKEYTDRYTFIRLICRDAKIGGKGKSAAMNYGFRNSKGEIILCFDADYYPRETSSRSSRENSSTQKSAPCKAESSS